MNKSEFRWQFMLGVVLVALSIVLYFIHFLIFRERGAYFHHTCLGTSLSCPSRYS